MNLLVIFMTFLLELRGFSVLLLKTFHTYHLCTRLCLNTENVELSCIEKLTGGRRNLTERRIHSLRTKVIRMSFPKR